MIATTSDGVRLALYETGPTEATEAREPILFIHEFGGDHRSWDPQVAHFARSHRCVTYDARGYPRSDVPTDLASYSQARAVDDAIAVLDAAGIDRALVVGNSMGGWATLHLGLAHPERCLGLVVAGCGYGAADTTADAFRADILALADAYERDGSEVVAADYGFRAARRQLLQIDPEAHQRHVRILAEHDPVGAALTLRGVQAARPSLFDLRDELAAMAVPTLLVVGDQDEDTIEANLMVLGTLPDAGLAVLPRAGHLTNLEDPAQFNGLVERFRIAAVAATSGATQ